MAEQVREDLGLVDEDAEGAFGVQSGGSGGGGDEVKIDGGRADRRAGEGVGHYDLLDLGGELGRIGGDGGVGIIVGGEEADEDGGAGGGRDGGWRFQHHAVCETKEGSEDGNIPGTPASRSFPSTPPM